MTKTVIFGLAALMMSVSAFAAGGAKEIRANDAKDREKLEETRAAGAKQAKGASAARVELMVRGEASDMASHCAGACELTNKANDLINSGTLSATAQSNLASIVDAAHQKFAKGETSEQAIAEAARERGVNPEDLGKCKE